ncbi:hypothetical protein M413DRAFT_449355 [Hebeloma cylindrosporum]|uniref:Alpha-type protein kinase domain-containing protein n=1 Tax=Hebeloma cylindrosporum TaxID=76867 RepID=A0A0C2XE35_HEBCY|nr:hypothetical protein M413DRAFT_449355 [Hebeloma cylindrosporum h7]
MSHAADMTSEGAVVCQRCHYSFASGTQLRYMASKDGVRPGRHLCDGCFNYYLEKPTTVRRPDGLEHPDESVIRSTVSTKEKESEVRKQIAEAQRGEGSHRVVAVGTTSAFPVSTVQYPTSGNWVATNQQSYQVLRTTPVPPTAAINPPMLSIHHPQAATSAHALRLPATANPFVSLPIPQLKPSPVNPGYQEAHQYYDEMRQYYASKAYTSTATAELVVVKVRMVTLEPGKRNPTIISNLYEAVNNIPVHIGVSNLKHILYHALHPQFLDWSKGFPLSIEECELRDKNWVQLLPRQPDIDAIAEQFFEAKARSKVKVFSAKKSADLSLCVKNEKYQDVLQHLIDLDEAGEEVLFTPKHSTRSLVRTSDRVAISSTRNQGKKRKLSDSETHKGTNRLKVKRGAAANPTAFDTSPSLRPPSITLKPDVVRRALECQLPPRKKDMKLLFNTTTIDIHFYRAPARLSFTDLIMKPDRLLSPQSFSSQQVTLSYRPSDPAATHGNFKTASVGYTSVSVFDSISTQVCVKQGFYTNPNSSSRHIYDGPRQAEMLTMELNCIGWASALMTCVYDFMKESETGTGSPTFDVPHMQYVQCGLAISKPDGHHAGHTAYLLEEYIDTDNTSGKNWFVKYLNNSSARPRQFDDPRQTLRAEFLSFAQHVQFWKTEGLAFVSDFQGGPNLLTDPQIITHPKLGLIFSEGNTNFDTFLTDHECNKFCKFYRLPPLQPPSHDHGSSIVKSLQNAALPDPDDDSDLPDSILP